MFDSFVALRKFSSKRHRCNLCSVVCVYVGDIGVTGLSEFELSATYLLHRKFNYKYIILDQFTTKYESQYTSGTIKPHTFRYMNHNI